MNTLDANAWRVLSDLLEIASDEFSNHGCNDYELDNTPENRELVKSMEIWNSLEEWAENGLNISKDRTKIYTQDFFLMSYFAHLAKELAGVD